MKFSTAFIVALFGVGGPAAAGPSRRWQADPVLSLSATRTGVISTLTPSPTSTVTATSTTTAGNGIQTPSPVQPSIVRNCAQFHLVVSGDRCSTISAKYGIPVDRFLEWNPAALSSCKGLKTNAYACVSVIGWSPSPTNPNNGIQTPLPAQPDVVSNCNQFHLVVSGDRCSTISAKFGIPADAFLKWNPGALSSCKGLKTNAYACVSTIGYLPSAANPGTNFQTPAPTQPDLVSNCNNFHLVVAGERCSTIAAKYSIPVAKFLQWNPKAGSNCAGLRRNAYACVSTWGHTPTQPDNGIATPSPAQPKMADNCDAFVMIEPFDVCGDVAQSAGISLADFISWNPSVGAGCNFLKPNAYACVSVIGHTPTTPGNGITTPQPTQPALVSHCNKFHLVVSGDRCSTVAARYGVPVAEFLAWNPQAGSNCAGLRRDAYACVGIVGFTPTPTNPGEGVVTPAPIQPGMVATCRTFHFVEKGQICATIQNRYKVSLADLVKWNPGIGADCTLMWADSYLCVGVL
ncbi:LysM domain-containing protein like [Verticillium longisporum]|uniref:LysM domain-containing protein like n=1 Tax=Verticillium longisporum TaxID=100787 RepID=A0A8I2ZE20_VERLO|nr:LysM domain-containing protein like [Verticillium longisporum]